mmetsp:Transcript_18157/g.45792  ORF Transcript_18157/g.45792 Transcript_18157/m.45792 type:complete len:272 (+) Transcript_18157:1642-2457(+)
MGGCHSTQNEAVNHLEEQLNNAVMASKQRGGSGKTEHQSFNALLLRFGKMRPGFLKVQDMYASMLKPGEKALTLAAFKANAPRLGINAHSVCLKSIFQLCDMHRTHVIDATELIMVFTVGYLMDREGHEASIDPDIKVALDLVEKAFCYFDSSSDGYLEKEEVMAALTSGSKVFNKKKAANKAAKGVGEILFDMIDYDKSGKISFKEFLIGVQKLVMSEMVDMDEMAEMEEFIVQSRMHSAATAARITGVQDEDSSAALPPPAAQPVGTVA